MFQFDQSASLKPQRAFGYITRERQRQGEGWVTRVICKAHFGNLPENYKGRNRKDESPCSDGKREIFD